ncbi:FAD-dependent monooxygenase [Chitinophaga sp. Hz27]|uniref:FAD-dependent monooxygenase n=1 Tax=Chitinophaga sp. Hz27 TaxID=3347169 RepID=UPI0035DAF99C
MHTFTHHPPYDVIISGAGPVGLFLACELALAKCSVLVLEKNPSPTSALKQLPFGMRGLNSLSIESLYRRGMLEELQIHKQLKHPHSQPKNPPPAPQAGHFAGIPLLLSNIDHTQYKFQLPSSTPTALISEMQELENVLLQRAVSLGVTILRDQAVTGFEQTADNVTVFTNDHTYTSGWLVGADGSRSVVRKNGGFDFAGTEPAFTGYTAKVEFADPEKLRPGRVATPHGLYLQSQPGYIVIQDFDGGAFHGAGEPLTLKHLQSVLRRISGTDITINIMHTATTWTDRARQATAYRNNRVLLAGDAAHIHSPLGGQGLNLGLGDAINLGWKLAATIHNNAPEGLLDSYFTERYPIGEKVLDWSRAQVAIMHPDPHSRALNAMMRELLNTRDGATYAAGRVWGIFTHYDLGGQHPLTGYSVPNFAFKDGHTIGSMMHDGSGILLDFHQNAALKTIAAAYPQHLKYISATPEISLGINALLIRPDGIVAWATDQQPDITELQMALDRWFTNSKVLQH